MECSLSSKTSTHPQAEIRNESKKKRQKQENSTDAPQHLSPETFSLKPPGLDWSNLTLVTQYIVSDLRKKSYQTLSINEYHLSVRNRSNQLTHDETKNAFNQERPSSQNCI